MCYNCWREWDSPAIINDKVISAAQKIDEIYKFHCAGASAHVVVDDWNVWDSSINFCMRETHADSDYTQAQKTVIIDALSALLELQEDERISALAYRDGIIR